MAPRLAPASLALLALALPACAGTLPKPAESPPTASPASPAPAPAPAPAGSAPAEAPAAAPDPASPPAKEEPGFPAPAALPEGDRWFVAVRPSEGGKAVVSAERHRRLREGGILREEVTWGRSFAEVAGARHGTVQVFALHLDGVGLAVSLLDGEGKPGSDRRLELASPFRPGTAWTVEGPGGPVAARVEALEEVETPAGKVRALRVLHQGLGHQGLGGSAAAMTTWYDAGLRPVRSEVRRGGPRGMLVEARAALAAADPSPGEARAALEWAERNLGK